MPHKGSSRNYKSTPGHKNPSTGLGRGYERARKEGVGVVPGAHPERGKSSGFAGPRAIGKQIGGAVSAVKKAVTPRMTHTAAEEESFKRRGQRAYYEGKIARNKKK